jgi:hypothetical protein
MKAFTLLLIAISMLMFACVSPVNMTQDRAKTLGKNHLEVNASYSRYAQTDNNYSNLTNNNYGGRIGYGLSDKVDLKARYERLVSTTEGGGAANYLSLISKIGLKKDQISLLIPLSAYFDQAVFESGSRYTIAPEGIFTNTMSNHVDVTAMFKTEYVFAAQDRGDDWFFGFKLGFGFSTDLDKWSIRPEGGLMVNPDDSGQIWSYGIGLIYVFDLLGKKQR